METTTLFRVYGWGGQGDLVSRLILEKQVETTIVYWRYIYYRDNMEKKMKTTTITNLAKVRGIDMPLLLLWVCTRSKQACLHSITLNPNP